MTCKTVRNLLSAYADCELAGTEMLAVRRHLHLCSECREEEAAVKSLKSVMGSLRVPVPSENLESKVLSQLSRTHAKRTAGGPRLGWLLAVSATAALATFAMLPARQNVEPKNQQLPGDSIAFEIQRDQMYVQGSDPLGAPVLLASDDVSH